MASLILPPGYQINNANGKPESGAKVTVYEAGTTTKLDIFSDNALTSALANPVSADSAGRLQNIYVAGTALFKIVVTTSADAAIFTSDDIPPYISSSTATLPVASGGTGSGTASGARTNLGAASATDVSTLSSTVSSATTPQDTADWEAGTQTTETVVSPAKVKAAIEALEATQSGVPDAVLWEEQTSGTDGGTFTSGSWVTRTLTDSYDPGSVVTLSTNTFEFTKAGYIEWSCPAVRCGSHQTRLYNVTDSVAVRVGTVEQAVTDATNCTRSFGWAVVAASKVYRLEHRCTSTRATNGLGNAGSMDDEIYSVVKFFSNNGA